MADPDPDSPLLVPALGRRVLTVISGRRGIGLGVLVIVLVLWQAVRTFNLAPDLFVPGPARVFDTFLRYLVEPYQNATLLLHFAITLARVFIAFGLALLTGIGLGLLAGMFWRVDAISEPIINFIRPLPPLSYYILLLIWLGYGEPSKVALLYLAALPPIVINTRAGVQHVPEELLGAARSLGARDDQIFRHVVLPSSLPFIFAGARIALGVTYATVVAAELLATQFGIGFVTYVASEQLRTDIVFVGVILLGLVGMALDFGAQRLERRLVPWLGKV